MHFIYGLLFGSFALLVNVWLLGCEQLLEPKELPSLRASLSNLRLMSCM